MSQPNTPSVVIVDMNTTTRTIMKLKSRVFASACVTAVLGFYGLTAQANPQIAKANQCFSCHSLDKKIIGPSFQSIAARYKNEPGALSKLSDRTRKGVVGVWGTTPMPAAPSSMSDADITAVTKWILSQ